MSQVAVASQWLIRTHGQGRINLEVVRALAASGHSVSVFATDYEGDPVADFERVAVPSRVPTNWAREQIYRRRGSQKVARWHGKNPDGILISNGAAIRQAGEINLAMFVHAAWLASAWHPRHGGGWHGRYQALYNRANVGPERRAFQGAQRVVALSEVVRDELIEHAGVDAASIVVIPPGVDVDEFRPAATDDERAALRRCCEIDQGPLLLIFAGEIRTRRKNLDLVLDAMVAVAHDCTGVHLAVAGSTSGSPYPELAAQLGLGGRVHFLGQRSDLPLLMRGADAFVFPSNYEPFGLVVTEAMASGLPVIVTRQTGASPFVMGGAGLVLDDGEQLEAVVEKLQGWRSDRANCAAAGRAAQLAVSSWTWKDMAQRYAALVAEVAK